MAEWLNESTAAPNNGENKKSITPTSYTIRFLVDEEQNRRRIRNYTNVAFLLIRKWI